MQKRQDHFHFFAIYAQQYLFFPDIKRHIVQNTPKHKLSTKSAKVRNNINYFTVRSSSIQLEASLSRYFRFVHFDILGRIIAFFGLLKQKTAAEKPQLLCSLIFRLNMSLYLSRVVRIRAVISRLRSAIPHI